MRFLRTSLIIFYDAAVAAAAFAGALLLRFDGMPPADAMHLFIYAAPYAVVATILGLMFRIPQAVLRYTNGRDILLIMQMSALSVLVIIAAIFFLTRLDAYPRSALVILWLLHAAMVAAPRVASRFWHNRNRTVKPISAHNKGGSMALLVGAGDGADAFLREFHRQPNQPYRIIGILDDNPRTLGRQMHGLTVQGPLSKLRQIYETLRVKVGTPTTLIFTESHFVRRAELLQQAQELGLKVQQVPDITNLADGDKLTNLRPVLIEDLLGRAAHKIDMSPIEKLVQGKRVLVTGAGGSIGSELCRQLLRQKPKELVLVESSEFNLYSIEKELLGFDEDVSITPILQDVRNAQGIETTFATHKPQLVFHAAAYKHVPLVEFNPLAGLTTNVVGSKNVMEAAAKHGTENMVLVSTDKAVNPTNVMGATKRASELVAQTLKVDLPVAIVRFGNVLGSSGSVIPLFRNQIESGGPLTVTHKDTMRYFMTIPEAVQLVLRAGAHSAEQSENRPLFMLDMGEPVRIWDVAEQMVRLSGLEPGTDIEIVESGLRPGEKLKEELWYDAESMSETGVDGLFKVDANSIETQAVRKQIATLEKALETQDQAKAVQALKKLVPDYTPANNSPYKD
jgi:O-antigen biosynthesis protein WbqV